MSCINPNNPIFLNILKKVGNPILAEIEYTKLTKEDFVIQNNATFLNVPDEERMKIYENYVNLMDRKREGKAVDFDKFNSVFDNLQVFKYKQTYIFGEWDSKNNIFKGRLMSSPGIKELYTALDVLIGNVDFVASVPSDIGKMLEKKGLYKLDVGKEYNFRGEEMIKNLYFSNKELAEKVFNKSTEKITYEEVKEYDSFFKYWSLIGQLRKEHAEKNYKAVFSILKKIGIYDYNAYKLVNKMDNLPNEEKDSLIKDIIKNSRLNKVNIDKTDLINNPKIYSELNNELNKTLATYLSKFGIKTKVLEDIQDKLNIDSFAHVDILNKIIYVSKNNQEDYPQQAGMLIAYMMQHNPLITEITKNMRKTGIFKNLSKDEMFQAIGDLISQELYKKTNTELPQSLIDSIKSLIRQFLDMLNSIKLNRINKNIGIIADNILIQNQSLITQSTFKPGAEGKKIARVSLGEALKKDEFANTIVDKLSEYFILTGSVTLSEQGYVFRPEENVVHDLDWISSLTREESIKLFESIFPNSEYIRNIKDENDQTDTWLIAPEGYKIKNLVIDKSKKIFKNGVEVGATNKILGYDIVDENDNVVSVYVPESDSHTGPIEAKAIDIFSYDRPSEEKLKNKEITVGEKTIKIADWRNTFAAKLKFGRLKDIWDYNRFIPYEYLTKETEVKEPTTEIKPGVQELFDSNPELANQVYEALGFNQPAYTKQSLIDNYGEKGKEIFDTLQSISWNLGSERYKVFSLSTDKILSLINYREDYNDVLKALEQNLNSLFSDIIKRKNINKELNDILDQFRDDVYESVKEKLNDRKKERGESIYGEEKFLKGNLLITLKSLEEFGFPSDKFNSLLEDAVEFSKTSEKGELNKSLEKIYDLLDSFKSLGEYESIDLVDYYTKKLESEEGITPQQKQQALQLYSQYLDTIFPDSKVKDIVYHVNKTGTISPIDNKAFYSTDYGSWLTELEEMKGKRIPILLNITNPTIVDSYYEFTDKAKKFRESGLGDEFVTPDEVRKPGTDSVIGRDSGQGKTEKTYVVYNSNQTHQLGTKQDIEGFKNFVQGEQKAPESEYKKAEEYLATKTSEENEDVLEEKAKPAKVQTTREQAVSDIVTKLKNLMTRLGINIKEFEEIYVEQQNINELTNKLQNQGLTQEERTEIENKIEELKKKGIDKKAIALADIMNRTINISVDGNTQDLTEEVLHFIVDIIEQKYPELYKELYDKVWSYEKYKAVKREYKDRYTTEEEFRKEAITQVLNDYLLNPMDSEIESDYQNNKTESFWEKIVNSLKNLFTKTSNVDINPFKIATERLLNSDLITPEDIKYLNDRGLFYSLKKTKSAEELRDDIIKTSKEIEIKENKEGKPRYFRNGVEVLKRVSDIVSNYYEVTFRNSEKKKTALQEQIKEEGIEIHAIFQHTFAKYVSANGEVLSTPIKANEKLVELTEKYPEIADKIDQSVREIIRINPDSYFLSEVKIANGTKIGGTIDLLVIRKKDGRTSIYDWKTKRGMKDGKYAKVEWWNVNAWRIQLEEYTKILRENGVSNFGEVRMIPIMTYEKKINNQWKIGTIQISPFERSKIDAKKRSLLPVIGKEETSPYETINKITQKIRAVINQNTQKIKADYRLREELQEENIVLENIYTILLATDNIDSALLSLQLILQDADNLVNEAIKDTEKINDLSDAELYQYYQKMQSAISKIKIYKDQDQGVTIANILKEIYGKDIFDIENDYKQALTNYKNDPSEQNKQKLEKVTKIYDLASSISKISTKIESVESELNKFSKNFFEAYSERIGVSGIFDFDLGQSVFGKIANSIRGLYSLNFKTAELASKILRKANSIIRDKNKQATESMYALRDKFLGGKVVTNLEKLFENLIYFDEDKNDYFLVPEISKEFAKEFFKVRDEFEKGYSSLGKEFFKTPEYKKIENWLKENIETEEWKKDFEEKKEYVLKKFEEANKVLKTQDILEYSILYENKIAQFNYFNNIFSSPKAWDSFKKYKYVKRTKWTSEEYKKLTDQEKELHKKFTSIYSKAERAGYVEGYQNYYRIPFKLRLSKSAFEDLNLKKAFVYRKEDEEYKSFSRIDPITGEEIIEVPVHMVDYLPAKEKGKLVKSLDLFQVYLEFEQNVNRFEEMNKVENVLLDIIKIEDNKKKEKQVNIFGKLIPGEPVEKEKAWPLLGSNREDVLKRLIFADLYKQRYEKDKLIPIGKGKGDYFESKKYLSAKKTFQWINNYSTVLFVQATLKVSGGAFLGSSLIASTSTSKNIKGSGYAKSLLQRINPFSSVLEKINPSHINKNFRKAFNYNISQKEVEELNLNRTEIIKRAAVIGKQYAIDHLKLVDIFVQDSIFDASLENFIVINDKIVNFYDFISSQIPNQDDLSYEELKEKEKELYERYKDKTLGNYLNENTKDGKTDISKLDKDSVYEFEDAIRLETKKIIGNTSEQDYMAMRLGFIGSLFSKFKSWVPELYNSFFGGMYWRAEGKRFEVGKITALIKANLNAVDNSDASDEDKGKIKTGIMYVGNMIKFLVNIGAFSLTKEKGSVKILENRYNIYVQELKELGVQNIPTRKEYIDLTLQEARNAKNFFLSVIAMYGISNILGILSGDDDPEDYPDLVAFFSFLGIDLYEADNELVKFVTSLLYSFTLKGMKEVGSYFSPEQAYETFSKLTFPALGAAAVLGKGIVSAGELAFMQTEDVKYIFEAIPFLRPAIRTYVKYSEDETLQEALNVNRNFSKRPSEEEE